VAKSHPSVEKEDPLKRNIIPKDPGKTMMSMKKGVGTTIQALGYEVGDYTRESLQKGKSPCSRVV